MKNFALILCLLSLVSCNTSAQKPARSENPKIVVGIVVDQMRQEYLHRFYDKFSDGGFKRLVEKGFQFRNGHYNYVPTYTAPGHASVYTGTTPSNHGIIGNDWYAKEKGLSIYCVSDLTASAVGGTAKNGKISPVNLISSTVTDELRTFSNFRSKVIGLSIKDRGAVLPAGHNPTGAFWMDGTTAEFMSSSYYFEKLPAWVEAFNNKKLPSSYLKTTWNTLLPIDQYVESTEDDVEYERILKGKERATFPYELSEMVKEEGIGLIRTTPFGNTLLVDLTLAAIEGEQMGSGDFTDFLSVSFSSTDYIGHAFGPNSIELEDTYLRLDQDLQRLLNYLDKKFPNEYQVFLTADHGVANVPQYQINNKLPGGYIDAKSYRETFSKKIEEGLGKGDWVLDISNNQIFLNQQLISERGMDLADVQNKVRRIVLSLEHVLQAYTATEISQRNGGDLYKRLLENGYNTQKSGDVLIRLAPGYLQDSGSRKGTTHGSGNTNDTHVPILFYGKNIPSGSSVRNVSITDIAPTVSMLLNISLPSNCTGQPLKELFD